MHPSPPKTGMSTRAVIGTVVGIVGTFLVVLMVIGLTIGDLPEEEPAAAPAAASSTSEAPAPSSPPASTAPATTAPAREVPEPTPAEQRTYLAALADIDDGLVVDEDRAMRRAGRICERITDPPGGTMTLPRYVVLELSGGNATIDEVQARQVIRAVRAWCN